MKTLGVWSCRLAFDRAIKRCAELGVQRGIWLCNDLLGLQAHFRGEPARALANGEANDRVPAGDRSADERFMTLALLHYATRAAGQIADSLRHGYRLLSLAEAMDSDEHRAHALHNLGALQADTFNVEDAVVLQEQALARKLGSTELPAPFTGDLLYTYAALNEQDKAFRTLSEWLAQPGGVTALDRHHQCAPIALAYLGVGRLEGAEQALALGLFPIRLRGPVSAPELAEKRQSVSDRSLLRRRLAQSMRLTDAISTLCYRVLISSEPKGVQRV